MVPVEQKRKSRQARIRYLFTSIFEERKVLSYYRQLFQSKLLYQKSDEMLKMASEIFGEAFLMDLMGKTFPSLVSEAGSRTLHGLIDRMPVCGIVDLLRSQVLPIVDARLKVISQIKKTDIEERLERLKTTFNLTDADIDIVTFQYLMGACGLADTYLNREGVADFSQLNVFQRHGDVLLKMKKGTIAAILKKETLQNADIIEFNIHHSISLEVTSWVSTYLSGIVGIDIREQFFTTQNECALPLSSFALPQDDMMVLDTLLSSRGRANVLIYGKPGTGKTSMVQSLAKAYQKTLYTVRVPESDDVKDHRNAIYATVNVADQSDSIILVDEADDLLNACESFFFKSKVSKSWINQCIENHSHKIIWITNRTEQIDPSTMRRFSFCVEFKKFDRDRRLKILMGEMRKRGLEKYFTDTELRNICETYDVNADGIVNAVNILKINSRSKKDEAVKKIRTILRSHEKAISRKRVRSDVVRNFEDYTLDGLNTNPTLEPVLKSLDRYFASGAHGASAGTNQGMSLLLYGLPGTGKSEFVYYLGHRFGKEVHLRRCSDILSCWVGETEKNIAGAFAEASANGGILFLDEADSFLFPRSNAIHSWEKMATNELLTQMEHFRGLAIFASNEIEGLDHAALRRFHLKIEFLPLSSEGNMLFYNTLLLPLCGNSRKLTEAAARRLCIMKSLTPGDFSVVRKQCMFQDVDDITQEALIASLENELKFKKAGKRAIGFAI
jgi:transitional endoplasmic reticulum ATPase